jgi:uncharacterized protein YjaZ
MRTAILITCFISSCLSLAGQSMQLQLNKEYKNISLKKTDELSYSLNLAKNGIYQFSILQQGIAVYYLLTGINGEKLYECNYPDDFNGYEKFEYSPSVSGAYNLKIKWFNDPENPDSGKIAFFVKSLNKAEIEMRNKIKKELEPENRKNVLTLDIDHFWESFDNLNNCKSYSDSVATIQKIYLDRATNGLLDFIQRRDLTAEKYVQAIAKNTAFYQSVRSNTYQAKKAEGAIEEVFKRFRELYSNFKPFKVCFAIGIKNTGGTVSNNYVLIGTELTSFLENNLKPSDEEIIQKIKSIVAHECVHTQQKLHSDSLAIKCELLDKSIREGAADFIAELVSGNEKKNEYGDQHESELWIQFKNELCNQNIGNWLYNGSSVKNKPRDLGYYIGYKIAESYYNNAKDKRKAIINIIEMDDPIKFLELSRYDLKFKK